MDKVLFNTVFNRKNQLLGNGTALIQIEAYMKGKKKYFSTNIYISPEQWDTKHRNIKNHPNQITLNKRIKDFADSLENAEMLRRQSEKPFTLDYLSEFIKGNLNPSFLEFCKKEKDSGNLRKSTKDGHQTLIKYLEAFKKSINFEDVNFEFLKDFDMFLREKNLHQNTISKNLGIVRRYINLAIDKEHINQNKYPFRKFKIHGIKTKRDYLTPEELENVENLRLTKDNEIYQLTLDKYLFSCYTGLRFSDISALKPTNLIIEDGKEWLILDMLKTSDPIRIPLYLPFYSKALDIFYKYVSKAVTVFKYQTNTIVNLHLKEIAKEAKINKKITFHTARHTQATYLLYKGVSITTVQKLLGHKNLATTQIYGKVMDMTVINELKNVSFNR